RVQPREEGGVDPGRAKGERLLEVGDAEASRSAVERSARDGHRAVTVGVRLDDGEQFGRCDETREKSGVVAHRLEVDARLAEQGAVGHEDSATTCAIAIPASCDI